jgi:hypothetical protein
MKKILKVMIIILFFYSFTYAQTASVTQLKQSAELHISQNQFLKAIQSYKDILTIDQADYTSLIQIARLYSWLNQNLESIKFYDLTIKKYPAKQDAYIEKARVLVWSGQMTKAKKAYQQGFEKFQLDWFKYEMLAKNYLRNHKIQTALYYYQKSLELKPDNSETLFDLAQLYSNLGLYDQADFYYQQLLKYHPYHSAAQKSLAKNNFYQKYFMSTEIGYNAWDALSSERQTDILYNAGYLKITKPLNQESSFFMTETIGKYDFRNTNFYHENILSFGFDYQKTLNHGLGAGVSLKSIAEISSITNPLYLYYGQRLWEDLQLDISYHQQNFINNNYVVTNNISETYLYTKLTYLYNHQYSFHGFWQSSNLSDQNSYYKIGADSRIILTPEPVNFYLDLELTNQNYSNTSTQYFAPQNYTTYAYLVGLKQQLNATSLYYGAPEIYYDIKVKRIHDSNQSVSNQFFLEFKYDLRQDLILKLFYTFTTSVYYNDKSGYFSLKWFI